MLISSSLEKINLVTEYRSGLDHNSGQRRSVRTADPTACVAPVGSAVRTDDLAVGAVAGVMTKAVEALIRYSARCLDGRLASGRRGIWLWCSCLLGQFGIHNTSGNFQHGAKKNFTSQYPRSCNARVQSSLCDLRKSAPTNPPH